MSFTKLHQLILDSSVWAEPHHVRIVWITMLAMADYDGVVAASFGGLVRRALVTEAECRDALDRLMGPDPDSRDGTTGERVEKIEGGWLVINYDKYRGHETKKQIATRERVRRFRAKRRAVTLFVTPCNESNVVTPEAEIRNQIQTVATATAPQTPRQGVPNGSGSGSNHRNGSSSNGAVSPARSSDIRAISVAKTDPNASEVPSRVRTRQTKQANILDNGRKAESERVPSNLEEALHLPINERAVILQRDPHMADWLLPQQWPEIIAVAKVWGDVRLGSMARDSGVRAAVEFYAAGVSQDEAVLAAETIKASTWAKQSQERGKKLGLSSMGLEAIRRALDTTTQGQNIADKFRHG